jgi:signal peptidase I
VVPQQEEMQTQNLEKPDSRARTLRRRATEWVVVLVVVVVAALVIRTFVVQVFRVPSGSMLPTLQLGDRLVVDKIPGLAHSIHRGDIIVFNRVPADNDPATPVLVKRVIGLPGETISSKGDTVYINGRAIREPWLAAMNSTAGCSQAAFNVPTTHITRNHYFVMGDCRGNSDDSRAWGTVPVGNVIGRVFVVIWRHNHPWFHWF